MILPFRDRDFQWGGCSHDVVFGTKFRSGNNLRMRMRKVITLQFRAVSTWKQLGGSIIIFDFSQEFVDAEEKDQIVLHNNEVGLDDDARMKNNVKKGWTETVAEVDTKVLPMPWSERVMCC